MTSTARESPDQREGAGSLQGTEWLVGRETELEQLGRGIAKDGRVVVVGPPGVGKTALVRAYTESRDADWVRAEIGDVSRGGEFMSRLAEEIGVDVPAGAGDDERLERVGAALEHRADGLWLDRVESVAGAAELFATLEEHLDALSVVVTSRREIPLSGAQQLKLGGLAEEPSVELFERGARMVEPEFELGPDERDDVRTLVERLDFLPLAIELAASRIGVLSPAGLLERIDRRFELLGDAGRQRRGLRESIDWSWELLDEAERACLRQISVFASDVSLEAIEAVVDLPDGDRSPMIVDVVDRLVRASWLQSRRAEDGSSRRFAMLESLRAFARFRLRKEGGPQAARRRYADYYLERGRSVADSVATPSGRDALGELRRAREHFTALFERLVDSEAERAAEAIWSLRWNARFGAAGEEVLELLEGAPEAFWTALDDVWRARLWMLRGEMQLRRGERERAADHLERAQELANRHDDLRLRGEVAAVSTLGLAHLDPDAAEDRLRSALDDALELGDSVLEGRVRERLGFVQLQTFRLEEARQSFRRARDLLSSRANPLLAAPATTGLAYVALRTGHGTGAATGFEETARVYEGAGDRRRVAQARFNHAVALHVEGELEAARRRVESALEIWARRGESRYEAIGRVRLALILAECGEMEAAQSALKAGVAAGQREGDWHNRGIAESGLVMVRLLERGPGVSSRGLEEAIRHMEFASDPDAAAAALATSAVLAAYRGRAEEAEEAVERIGAVRSLLSTTDVHLGRVIDGLYALAGTWAERLLAEARPEAQSLPNGGRRRETLRRFVPSIYDDGDRARAEAGQLASPYLRLLFTAAPLPFGAAESSVEFLTGVRPGEADRLLTVHREGHWFRIEGESPTSLMSRQPLRRIVRSIVESHLEVGEPGRGVEELIEAGWPDAVVTKDSGSNRVYTAIRTLRDMGLEEYLVTGDQGYRFAASIAVRCTDEGIDAFRNR